MEYWLVSENERYAIRQRQKEGIAAAKAKGVRFGRPPISLPENFEQIYLRWKEKEVTGIEAARLCDCFKTTFYRKTKYLEKENPH